MRTSSLPVYMIKSRRGAYYIPVPKYKSGAGSTHVEPVQPDIASPASWPRLFRTRGSARSFLVQWCRGKAQLADEYRGPAFKLRLDYDSAPQPEPLVWVPQPLRRYEDFVIVEHWLAV